MYVYKTKRKKKQNHWNVGNTSSYRVYKKKKKYATFMIANNLTITFETLIREIKMSNYIKQNMRVSILKRD